MRLKTVLPVAACAAVLSTIFVAGAQDYTTLPAEPREMVKMIKGRNISLVDAIRKAEEATGGVANSASFRAASQPLGSGADVEIFTETERRHVIVDGITGEIAHNEAIPRFPGWGVRGTPNQTESGLMFFDVQVGDGPQPSGPSTRVKVHYTGYLIDGTKFDSSVDRGQPAVFELNRVIAGWTEGVGSMQVGGKRKLIVPFQLAYGEQGRPGAIPPRATLVFDVELLAIAD